MRRVSEHTFGSGIRESIWCGEETGNKRAFVLWLPCWVHKSWFAFCQVRLGQTKSKKIADQVDKRDGAGVIPSLSHKAGEGCSSRSLTWVNWQVLSCKMRNNIVLAGHAWLESSQHLAGKFQITLQCHDSVTWSSFENVPCIRSLRGFDGFGSLCGFNQYSLAIRWVRSLGSVHPDAWSILTGCKNVAARVG